MSEKIYNFSYSKIALYEDCPKKYELQVIKKLDEFRENIYTVFGEAVHKAIELSIIKKYDYDEALIIFQKELRERMKLMDPRESQLIFVNEWVNKAKSMLNYYFENFYNKIVIGEIEPLDVEKYFKYEIMPNVFYNGIIDFLCKCKEKITSKIKVPVIKVLKSGKEKKIMKEEIKEEEKIFYKILDWKTGALKNDNMQLLSYTIPLFFNENLLVDEINYIYLKHTRIIKEKINEEKINDTKTKIISIINNIIKDTENNTFNMKCDEKKCKYCSVKKYCDKEFELLLNSKK